MRAQAIDESDGRIDLAKLTPNQARNVRQSVTHTLKHTEHSLAAWAAQQRPPAKSTLPDMDGGVSHHHYYHCHYHHHHQHHPLSTHSTPHASSHKLILIHDEHTPIIHSIQ